MSEWALFTFVSQLISINNDTQEYHLMIQKMKIKNDEKNYLLGGKFFGEGLTFFGKGL